MTFDKQEYNRDYYQANRADLLTRSAKRYADQKAVKQAEHKRLCEAYRAAQAAGIKGWDPEYKPWIEAYVSRDATSD